jgi:hypothetical protein
LSKTKNCCQPFDAAEAKVADLEARQFAVADSLLAAVIACEHGAIDADHVRKVAKAEAERLLTASDREAER